MPIVIIVVLIIVAVVAATGFILFAPQKQLDSDPKRIPVKAPDIAPLPPFDGQPEGLAPGMYCFGHIWHWDGSQWNHISSPNIEPVTAIHGFRIDGSKERICASAWEEVWIANNRDWVKVHGTKDRFFGAWTDGERSFICGVYGSILCFDADGTLEDQSVEAGLLNGISGANGSIYAVGTGGKIFRSSGDGEWSEESSGVESGLGDVCAAGDTAIAVGENGVVLRRNQEGEWKQELSTTTETFSGVWTDGEVAYAVTSSGSICARKLGVWVKEHGTSSQLTDVFAIDPTQIIAVGLGGSMFWSGGDGEWTDLSGTRSMTINCVWGTSSSDLWIGGDQMYEINEDGDGEGVEIVASVTV